MQDLSSLLKSGLTHVVLSQLHMPGVVQAWVGYYVMPPTLF
jgi:hypothetical protein